TSGENFLFLLMAPFSQRLEPPQNSVRFKLESAVLDQLRAILRAPNLLGDMLPQAIKLDPTLDEAKITVAMTRLDAIWDQLFPAEQTRIVKLLVEKVIVSPNDLEVRLRANGIERLVLDLRPEPVE